MVRDQNGNLYVAFKGDSQPVKKYSSTGTLLAKWGSFSNASVAYGQYSGAYNLYLMDVTAKLIYKY